MNARYLAAFLCLATLNGCIVVDGDGPEPCCQTTPQPARPGNVTFLWTFGGQRCDGARNVKGVNIRIPGELLLNEGAYACTTAGVDGITLNDFAPGTYSFSIDGVGYQNEVLYSSSGTFTINGDARVTVDLTPFGTATSYAYLNWSFPGNASCAQAGVTNVEVVIDQDNRKTFRCEEGNGFATVVTPYLDPGPHYIEFSAFDALGSRRYFYRGELTTQAGAPVDASYTLWSTGGAAFSWTLSDGVANWTCSQAQVEQVSIDLQHADGWWVFSSLGDWRACGGPPAVYDFLSAGRYRVSMFARDSTGATYRSADNLYIDVVAGQYPTAQSALNVLLVRPQQ